MQQQLAALPPAMQLFGRRIFLRPICPHVQRTQQAWPGEAGAAEHALAARAARENGVQPVARSGSRESEAQRGGVRKRSRSGGQAAVHDSEMRGRQQERSRESTGGGRRRRSWERSQDRSHTPGGATAQLPGDAPLVPVCVRQASGPGVWSLCSKEVSVR